tara:strand:+ start:356 stop:628 length:273 start_codon:yes stop_codon:yes gene_type:complete
VLAYFLILKNEDIKDFIMADNVSKKNGIVLLLLLLLIGVFGVHRFYAGRIGTGIIFLFTFGIFGLGLIYDLILVLTQKLKDGEGKNITFD